MTITEVKINCVTNHGLVVAYASIVFDGSFVVHDLRLIRSGSRLIVAMPDRTRKYPCPHCSLKCTANANFCQHCGMELPKQNIYFIDIAHPITAECRQMIDKTVIDAYIKIVGHGQLLSAIHPSSDHASQSVSQPSQPMHRP